MTFWIVLVVVLAVLLMLSVDRIMARIGVRPERLEDTGSELSQLTGSVERWASARRKRVQPDPPEHGSGGQVDEQNSQATRSSTRR